MRQPTDDQAPGRIGKATDKVEAYRYLFALAPAGGPAGIDNPDVAGVEENDGGWSN